MLADRGEVRRADPAHQQEARRLEVVVYSVAFMLVAVVADHLAALRQVAVLHRAAEVYSVGFMLDTAEARPAASFLLVGVHPQVAVDCLVV